MQESVLPFGAAKSEAVGKLASERLPEFLLLLLREIEEGIVVVLKVLIFLDDGRVSPAASSRAMAAAAAITTASSATLSLRNKLSQTCQLTIRRFSM